MPRGRRGVGRGRPLINNAPVNGWESKMRKGKPQSIPGHLRGKQIGMYFANKYKQRQQTEGAKKEMFMTFGIPESVENRVRLNLKSIGDLAKELKIGIAPVRNPFIKSEKKASRDTGLSIGVDQFNINWEPNAVKDDYDEKPDLNMSIESIDDSDTFKKPQPMPGTSSGPDCIPIKTKKVPETPDFIAIKNEDPDQYETGEDIRALHGEGHYKYSYEDIITGTFEEKLDESLNKGVSINALERADETNKSLINEYKIMQDRNGYKKMMEFRKTLPTFKKAKELLDVIQHNQVVVISGETGCGKSTQVPQIILDNAILNMRGANTKIIVTQPRRIAASSLAQRVAQERGEKMGNSVGYAVRLEKVESRGRGSIMYVTTGVLLADLETNQGLTEYSHVILDEVHERDCHIDLSMCMLKKVLRKRKDLKLILMSATLDAENLSAYFNHCPMMHIEGLAYPVQDVYMEDILMMTSFELPPVEEYGRNERLPPWKKHVKRFRQQEANQMEKQAKYYRDVGPWVDALIQKGPEYKQVRHTLLNPKIDDLNINLIADLLEVISKGQEGAILVFLPGIGEISKLIREMESQNRFPSSRFEIFPLHSKLPTLDQHKIFDRPTEGKRKIIIATNIAETSITIDDIVFVVDCAKIKISGLNVEENYSTLKVEWVAQANLRQRRGRAGRCQPGICYHLLTSFRAEQLAERLLPELQRSDLLEPVLTIKRLRLGMAGAAMDDMPSPPAESTVRWAIKHLRHVGALNGSETLTPLGWHLARLPVHPSAGKLVLFGALFGCLDRAASVAAVWGFKDPFQLVIGKEKEVDDAKRSFALGEPSDHIAISEAIIQWENCSPQNRYRFAYRNFLSNNTLELLTDMKHQLGDSLKQMGFLPSGDVKSFWENRNRSNLSLFKAIVAAALYPKVARVKWIGLRGRKFKQPRIKTYLTDQRGGVSIHPSSIMVPGRHPGAGEIKICDNPGANWLVYWLCQKSSELFLIEVSLVYTLPLLFFGELSVKEYVPLPNDEEGADMCVMSILSVNIRCKKSTALCLFELRAMLDQVLAAKVMGCGNKAFQESVLNAVIELITAEDERAEYIGDDQSESDASERE